MALPFFGSGMKTDLVIGMKADIFFPGGLDGKASACNVGDLGTIPGLQRSPGEGNGMDLTEAEDIQRSWQE